MSITDKTRKILWGSSGNRCAICKKLLVADATEKDDPSVVADECHIRSAQLNGPRFDSSFPAERIDDCENLILLCRVDHKRVDDQAETYTTEILVTMREQHQEWVKTKLNEQRRGDAKVFRIKENIPKQLARITSGRELLKIVGGMHSASFDHDEPKSNDEMKLIASFLQNAQDWGDIYVELEAGAQVEAAYQLSQEIERMEAAGFKIYGAMEVQVLRGSDGSRSNWPSAILRIVRNSEAG